LSVIIVLDPQRADPDLPITRRLVDASGQPSR
jgi:hypothetical protein